MKIHDPDHKEINLQLAAREDIELLRRWKNANKQYFFDRTEISQSMQKNWFQDYELVPDDAIYVIHLLGTAVGTVGIRRRSNWDVYNVLLPNRQNRNKGIMRTALTLTMKEAQKLDPIPIEVAVLKDNYIGQRFYRSMDFIEVAHGEEKNYLRMMWAPQNSISLSRNKGGSPE